MAVDAQTYSAGEVGSDELIPTRATLLSRIRDLSAADGWQDFFETYWKLIYNTARRSGLTDAEAQDVVQETMIGVAKNIPSFKYDPRIGSFKTWLMNLVLWRIKDQFRRRIQHEPLTSAMETPAETLIAAQWEADWEKNLLDAATERVRNRIKPQLFQIFAFCDLQKKSTSETARLLNVSSARVYLARHRVKREIAREVRKLQRQNERRK